MASRPRRSGRSTVTWRSKRPGRSSAASSPSGRLVAASTITAALGSNPSMETSSWFRVCSRSSLVPTPRGPPPRWRPMASISSMKTMAGAAAFAFSKRSRTRLAPTPTNISTNSLALMLRGVEQEAALLANCALGCLPARHIGERGAGALLRVELGAALAETEDALLLAARGPGDEVEQADQEQNGQDADEQAAHREPERWRLVLGRQLHPARRQEGHQGGIGDRQKGGRVVG